MELLFYSVRTDSNFTFIHKIGPIIGLVHGGFANQIISKRTSKLTSEIKGFFSAFSICFLIDLDGKLVSMFCLSNRCFIDTSESLEVSYTFSMYLFCYFNTYITSNRYLKEKELLSCFTTVYMLLCYNVTCLNGISNLINKIICEVKQKFNNIKRK